MQKAVDKGARFLVSAQNPDGGWGYSASPGQSMPEPSCYSLLALDRVSGRTDKKGLSWLQAKVAADGAVRLEGDDEVHWTTSLAAWTLARLDPGFPRLSACLSRLLTMKGSKDSTVGWAWNEETYSWVEPTCYAVLALKQAGRDQHPRVLEAQHMLESRACVGGGWNQGLRVSFHRELGPLPAQTALAMLALQNRVESTTSILAAGRFLGLKVRNEPSTLSLALAILALHATGQDYAGLPEELEKRQGPEGSWRESVHLTALAVLALRAVKEGRNVFKF